MATLSKWIWLEIQLLSTRLSEFVSQTELVLLTWDIGFGSMIRLVLLTVDIGFGSMIHELYLLKPNYGCSIPAFVTRGSIAGPTSRALCERVRPGYIEVYLFLPPCSSGGIGVKHTNFGFWFEGLNYRHIRLYVSGWWGQCYVRSAQVGRVLGGSYLQGIAFVMGWSYRLTVDFRFFSTYVKLL